MSYFTKLSCSQRLMTLAACGAIIATIPINAAKAAPTDLSSYQASCRNIDVAGATLTASCRRINGTYNRTSILIRGIFNGNGILLYTSNPRSASSYQASCRNIDVAGATLTASCRRIDGRYRSTSILIKGIYNNNGVLRYS
ncbi:CVNH domain-containing protein [Nostoc sp.]|uniref:mannose-binding lectin n=1 Tax=Nostoc sp. TaxID=1180 RepID=UPI002FFA45BF